MTEEQREDENSVGMLYTKGVTMFEKEAEERNKGSVEVTFKYGEVETDAKKVCDR